MQQRNQNGTPPPRPSMPTPGRTPSPPSPSGAGRSVRGAVWDGGEAWDGGAVWDGPAGPASPAPQPAPAAPRPTAPPRAPGTRLDSCVAIVAIGLNMIRMGALMALHGEVRAGLDAAMVGYRFARLGLRFSEAAPAGKGGERAVSDAAPGKGV